MKSILVHLDASPRVAERLALAQRLARRDGAELKALYAVLPSLLATPWVASDGVASTAALMADIDRAQRERARAAFDRAAHRGPLIWAEADGETLLHALQQHALYADLVVLGQHDAGDHRTGALPADLVPALIADSGKPALVVPFAGAFDVLARQVLVAWKPTREAARAVTAALPWLQQADGVHLAMQPEPGGGAAPEGDPFEALEHWLRLNGVHAPIERHRIGPVEIGEALLSLAADLSAELLVMGCYGHSRAREWVLGGASRTVLRSMTLPVLMVH